MLFSRGIYQSRTCRYQIGDVSLFTYKTLVLLACYSGISFIDQVATAIAFPVIETHFIRITFGEPQATPALQYREGIPLAPVLLADGRTE